jgi:hypothetical protein
MKLFRVAAAEEVVVGAEVVVGVDGLAEAAVVEVAIADLAEVAVGFGTQAAEVQAVPDPEVQADALCPEGQALLGERRTTAQYATVRTGPPCLDVLELVLEWSPDPEEAKALFGEDLAEVPVELFVVLEEGPQGALAAQAAEQLGVFGGQEEAPQGALPAREAEPLGAFPEVTAR